MFSENVSRVYRRLVQKTQAGIKFLAEGMQVQTAIGPMQVPPVDAKLYDPKHLRVGINNQIVEASAVSRLLVEKGVFTWEELGGAFIIAYEAEVERMEALLSEQVGGSVTLDVPSGFD